MPPCSVRLLLPKARHTNHQRLAETTRMGEERYLVCCLFHLLVKQFRLVYVISMVSSNLIEELFSNWDFHKKNHLFPESIFQLLSLLTSFVMPYSVSSQRLFSPGGHRAYATSGEPFGQPISSLVGIGHAIHGLENYAIEGLSFQGTLA